MMKHAFLLLTVANVTMAFMFAVVCSNAIELGLFLMHSGVAFLCHNRYKYYASL